MVNAEGIVTHCSANVATMLGLAAHDLLGAPLFETLREAILARLNAGETRFFLAHALDCNGKQDVLVNAGNDGSCAIEIYPHHESNFGSPQPLLLLTPQRPEQVEQLQQQLLELIANLTGYQRVMLYQFREDGDGEVVAEVRQPEVYGSYLGLRFPASDVPKIARTLYLKNPWRLIPDAAAASSDVLRMDGSVPDLTYCDLRSVSPMHQTYLANMGVRASLSFSVVVNDVLVALVACHHSQPRPLPPALLEACRSRVSNFSFAYASYSAHRRIRLVDGLNSRFNEIRRTLQRHGDLDSTWSEIAPWIMREFDLDGVTLCRDTVLQQGTTLHGAALLATEEWFSQRPEIIWSEDSLPRHLPLFPLSEVAGVMALRIGFDKGQSTRLYLCRTEQVQEIAWGGNPEKPVEFDDGKLGIAPRRSFEKWVEKRLGYCRPWDNESRLLALKLRELLNGL